MTDPLDRQGFSPIWVLVGIIIALALIFAVCAAADEDGVNDLGLTELVSDDYDDDGSRNNRNRNGNDCNRAKAQCSDDDFSPSFDKSPVEDSFNIQVCVTPGSCTGGEEEA